MYSHIGKDKIIFPKFSTLLLFYTENEITCPIIDLDSRHAIFSFSLPLKLRLR